MNAKEFYERVDQARGDLSFRAFVKQREGFHPKLVKSFTSGRNRNTFPTTDTILLVKDLFEDSEVFEMLHSKIELKGIDEKEQEHIVGILKRHYGDYYRKWKRLKTEAVRLHSYNVLGG